MSAVGLEQQRSEAVGAGSNLCRVRYFLRFHWHLRFHWVKLLWYPPPPLTHIIFLISEILWKTGGFPYQVFRFGPVRHIFFRQYRDATLSYAWKFSIPEFFETQKGSPTKFFGTVRQKKIQRKIVISPFLCIQLFDTRNFLKHWMVPPRNFSALWDKKFWTKSRDTLFCIKYRNQWWNWFF